MVRKLVLVALVAVCVTGCSTDPGPNDPKISGEQITKQRDSMMSPEERAKFNVGQSGAPGPGGKPGNAPDGAAR